MPEEDIYKHLEQVDTQEGERRIAEALGSAGLGLLGISEYAGEWYAVVEVSPNSSYTKFFNTRPYPSLAALVATVEDTTNGVRFDLRNTPMNIFSSALFEYLIAEMLPRDGQVTLTISKLEEKAISGPRGESMKPVAHFVERPKMLILNKTNVKALVKVLGPETNDWVGAKVALGVEDVRVGRESVPSIRIKAVTPKPAAAKQ